MPIYEYQCRKCSHQFEALVRPPMDAPACPACQSQDLERLLSMFAVSSESTKQQALQDGRRRGSKVKKEKDIAQLEYEKEHAH
jgi:putative FmdB family regulatory protein